MYLPILILILLVSRHCIEQVPLNVLVGPLNASIRRARTTCRVPQFSRREYFFKMVGCQILRQDRHKLAAELGRNYGTQTQSQLACSSQIFDLSKKRTKMECNAGSLEGRGAGTPPKLNSPKRWSGKRFSRSGCPKRAVTGNGRARSRVRSARAARRGVPRQNRYVTPA